MPIDIETFESSPEDRLQNTERTNADRVMGFLAANPDQAFTQSEIRDATDVKAGSISVVLSRRKSWTCPSQRHLLGTRRRRRHRGLQVWPRAPKPRTITSVQKILRSGSNTQSTKRRPSDILARRERERLRPSSSRALPGDGGASYKGSLASRRFQD